MGTFLFFIVVAAIIGGVLYAEKLEREKISAMPEGEREKYVAEKVEAAKKVLHGPLSPQMVCPHCQVKGNVRTKPVTEYKGIDGGKATGALLTGGLSVLATGLSRKEVNTQAFCEN